MSNLGAFSMWELFRGEVESQMRVLTSELLALENSESPKEQLASAMRAAHSIKGAARIVNLNIAVTLAHTMEDCLVAAQEGALTLNPQAIDVLLQSADLLAQVATVEESAVPEWIEQQGAAVDALIARLTDVRSGKIIETPTAAAASAPATVEETPAPVQQTETPSAPATETGESAQAAASSAAPATKAPARASRPGESSDRAVKVAAQTFNRLMGFAGESLVQSRWFEPFSESMLGLKRRHNEIDNLLQSLQPFLEDAPAQAASTLAAARRKLQETRDAVGSSRPNSMDSDCAPPGFRIVSTGRWLRAGCVRLEMACMDFPAWSATSRDSLANRCSSK